MPVVQIPSLCRIYLLPECYSLIRLQGSLGTPQYVLAKTNRSAWGLLMWSEGQTTQGIYNGGVLSGPPSVLSHLKAALEDD
uniref:DUF72 domain-containing protein n=1 Tax=Echinococcus granulosus TaxID=6210 RepID=A0A068X4A4_ECHGR|nr:hypothetical protein EgrG_000323900 [Echinococcus granulosus]